MITTSTGKSGSVTPTAQCETRTLADATVQRSQSCANGSMTHEECTRAGRCPWATTCRTGRDMNDVYCAATGGK
jgi:hypothetical protein